jgi:hypothetical protein
VSVLAIGVSTIAPPAMPQSDTPNLTRQQRTALQTVVRAVDANTPSLSLTESDWPLHVLRASDGSHYVAFSLNRADGLQLNRPLVLYVRLASKRRSGEVTQPERSSVAEWLAGQSPVPVLPRRGLAFGEMPIYGAAGIAQRGAQLQAQNLQLLELERERAREKREAQERARKASLEGAEAARPARPLLPFEDFDVRAQAVADSGGTPVLRRSFTAGPGDYELTVGWTDVDATASSPVHVARRTVTLPAASTTALALSSVIVADDIAVRATPVAATEQTAYPYSIGSTEVKPARDHVLSPDERLALIVQVINARGTPLGKPDVDVRFRVFRRTAEREENVGSLAAQQYNELTLPLDFDVAKGHPIFAAVAMPLRTFKRGVYRLEIAVNDRVAGAGIATDVEFTVAATPAALLREAPPLGRPFRPEHERLSTALGVIRGGVHASDGNDRDAIAAWEGAIQSGTETAIVAPLIVDAWLRLGDAARALEVARHALTSAPNDPRLSRQLAAAHILAGRFDEALTVLEAHLQREPTDLDAQWLVLHTLFAGFVAGHGPGASADGRARLVDLAGRYADAHGAHAELARDWSAAVR